MREEHGLQIGRMVAKLREDRGWSQRALASWVGLDQSAVSRIEAGRRRVSVEELGRLAEALQVPTETLLGASAPWASGSSRAALSRGPVDLSREADEAAADLTGAPRPFLAVDRAHQAFPAHGSLAPSVAAPSDLGWVTRRARRMDAQADDSPPLPTQPGPGSYLPASSRPVELPAEVRSVIDDWFVLRRLAGEDEATTPIVGASASGVAGPPMVQPWTVASPGAAGGVVAGADGWPERVARFWRSELHVDADGPVPDLVPLLEDVAGVQIVVSRSAGPQPSCAALASPGPRFIYVNAARPVVLQRFALAHAFGHLALGHGDIVDRRIEWSRNNPVEATANDFAEELLAPAAAVARWYARHGRPAPDVDLLVRLANAFGISFWAALYRLRAAERLNPKRVAQLTGALRRREWQLLPRQAFLGGLRDTLSWLSADEVLPPGEEGEPALLRVPALMREWTFRAIEARRCSVENAAGLLRLDPADLAESLDRAGLE